MAHIIKDRVKETSTSTGTGTIALLGAMTGFRAFSAVCSVGDTVRYAIQAVDTNGLPTGDWEVGYGTYSASNTLTRTTVIDSNNAGAAVNFTTGTKQVWVGMDATMAGWVRERLTANRTYYVATTGSDSNNGLSAGSPFLTIQKAVDVVCGTIDTATYAVTIQVADGTYTTGVVLKPYVGGGSVTITGNAITPTNVVVNPTSATCFSGSHAGNWTVSNLKVTTTTSGSGLSSSGATTISFSGVDFGATPSGSHLTAQGSGSLIATGNYTVSGGGNSHVYSTSAGRISTSGRTVTISGTPAFVAGWAWCDRGDGYFEMYSMTFSGSATGAMYNLAMNAVCFVNGGGANYLPGNVAGTIATGAQYA